MSGVPRSGEIDKSIRELAKEARLSQSALNHQAGQLVAKGCYERAETLVAKAKALEEFHAKISVLRDEWRQLRRGGNRMGKPHAQTTPLWSYYQPILHTLLEMGGSATRQQIEAEFERIHAGVLQSGDMEIMAGSMPRWQKMIRRARKHLIEQEFIEAGNGKVWQITDEGKRAARTKARSEKS
jgi:hypothetical protein